MQGVIRRHSIIALFALSLIPTELLPVLRYRKLGLLLGLGLKRIRPGHDTFVDSHPLVMPIPYQIATV